MVLRPEGPVEGEFLARQMSNPVQAGKPVEALDAVNHAAPWLVYEAHQIAGKFVIVEGY